MMLLYVLVPSFFIWLVSQSYLYYRGHYPVRLFPIQALVLVCSVWLGIDAVDRDDPLLYVGFLVPIASSTLLVCSILRAPRCVPVLAALPVVGYAVLCVAFCLLDAAVSACVCGACLVLVGWYAYELVETADDGEPLLQLVGGGFP